MRGRIHDPKAAIGRDTGQPRQRGGECAECRRDTEGRAEWRVHDDTMQLAPPVIILRRAVAERRGKLIAGQPVEGIGETLQHHDPCVERRIHGAAAGKKVQTGGRDARIPQQIL